mmetsp:Transcript_52297/g.136697  ORF Transcript_52297/g.136697 Transcript_52297/m.136697 type:complete len:299 (+) Transcript_52297:364-1260(+)
MIKAKNGWFYHDFDVPEGTENAEFFFVKEDGTEHREQQKANRIHCFAVSGYLSFISFDNEECVRIKDLLDSDIPDISQTVSKLRKRQRDDVDDLPPAVKKRIADLERQHLENTCTISDITKKIAALATPPHPDRQRDKGRGCSPRPRPRRPGTPSQRELPAPHRSGRCRRPRHIQGRGRAPPLRGRGQQWRLGSRVVPGIPRVQLRRDGARVRQLGPGQHAALLPVPAQRHSRHVRPDCSVGTGVRRSAGCTPRALPGPCLQHQRAKRPPRRQGGAPGVQPALARRVQAGGRRADSGC